MSTRCSVHFCDKVRRENIQKVITRAIVYRHCDGYPEAMLPDLQSFIDTVSNECSDTRFNDPEYLAAKFVVWQANELRNTRSDSFLEFLGVGVCREDPGDIEYRYKVVCEGKTPSIEYEEVRMYSIPKYEVEYEEVRLEERLNV